MLLTDFLRHELGATGTHVGCEHGVCGACTVEIDGAPARACLTLAVQADGATIRTVEGLAPEPGRLSVLQDAFRRHHALQCGFCTRRHPDVARHLSARHARRRPSTEVREFLGGHLCRCTGYVPIVAAVLDAAQSAAGTARCLISAPASSPAWRAIRMRSPSSTATCASPTGSGTSGSRRWSAGFDELELERRRPSRHAAAEPLGGGDAALGLPVRRHRRDAAELARHRRRARLLPRRRRRQGAGLRGGVGATPSQASKAGAAPSAHRGRRAGRHLPFELAGRQARRPDVDAARRRRRLVGDALHLGHHRQAQGRAAPPARRARRRARPCGAEPLPLRRAHARRDAALSHHGRALAARDVADRRRVRLPAALRRGARAAS